jgi:hypothetical protein
VGATCRSLRPVVLCVGVSLVSTLFRTLILSRWHAELSFPWLMCLSVVVSLDGCVSRYGCLSVSVSLGGSISRWVYLSVGLSLGGSISRWVYLSVGMLVGGCTFQCVYFSVRLSESISLSPSLSVRLSQSVSLSPSLSSLSERACRCFFDWCFFDWCVFGWCRGNVTTTIRRERICS